MKYVRRYTGPDGETHFEDLEMPMQLETTSTGVHALKGRSVPIGHELTFTKIDASSADPAAAGSDEWGPWHPASRAHFVLWLEGEMESQVSDGEVRRFGAGQLLLSENTTGKGHRNRRLTPNMRSIFIPLAPSESA